MYRNIKAEQARKGMTNQQVADYLGISRSGYENKLKTGKFFVDECLNLCKLFNAEFSYLFEVSAES